MALIRPQAAAQLARWREAMIGGAIAVFGAYWALTGLGLIAIFGVVIFGIGAVVLFTGWQRARVRWGKGGAGMVEVVERQVTFFDAFHGQSFSLDEVISIQIATRHAETTPRTALPPPVSEMGDNVTPLKPALDPNAVPPEMYWMFERAGGEFVEISAAAEGAGALFDLLAGFPGADYDAVVAASRANRPQRFVIWQKQPTRLH